MIQYRFMYDVIVKYLSDKDILLSLLLTNKSYKNLLNRYNIKSYIDDNQLKLYNNKDSYINVNIHKLKYNSTVIFYDSLINGLTHIKFGDNFNQVIEKDVLPNSLAHLTFGFNYNQKIEKNVLPNLLTHLTFGFKYNQKIEKDVLPNSLTHLTIGLCYNQIIQPNILPKSIICVNRE